MLEASSSNRSIASTEESLPNSDKSIGLAEKIISRTNSGENINMSPSVDVLSGESIHIIFVVHGIGVSQASLQDNDRKLKETLEKIKKCRPKMFSKRVEFKMLDWKSFLLEEKFHKIEEITLKNLDGKRHLMNTIPADILFYLSKSHSKKILTQIAKQMNEIAAQYSEFKDIRYSFLAHSLGTVIAYDLLQKNYKLKTELSHKTSNKIRLAFDVDYIFNIGSPLSLFLTISHDQKILPLDELKFIKGMYNIYHPHDLFAYRLEPALSTFTKIKKPCHIPFYKNDGYKRHKENASFFQGYCCPKKKKFVQENTIENNKRYDFELQESFLEYCIETLGIIESHTCYWNNLDAMYFILRQIHEMGY